MFVDTWSKAGQSTKDRDPAASAYSDDSVTQDLIKQYYSPVRFNIADFEEVYYKQIGAVKVPDALQQAVPRSKGTLPMYYKMYCCDKMRQEHEEQNGFKYDCVIRARPDMFLDKSLQLPVIESETVYRLCQGEFARYPSFTWDVFFLGSSSTMTNVCSLFNRLPVYWAHAQKMWDMHVSSKGAHAFWDSWKGSFLLSNHINISGYGVETLPHDFCLEDKERVKKTVFVEMNRPPAPEGLRSYQRLKGLLRRSRILRALYVFARFCKPQKWPLLTGNKSNPKPLIVMSGGYGYGNSSDEAQLGACIDRWREALPDAEIKVLSPNPAFTHKYHDVESVLAPRVIFFHANRSTDYGYSTPAFCHHYWRVSLRCLFAANCIRLRLPVIGVSATELELMALIASASVVHLTGGGYLTGDTRSRLWDNMLLVTLANILGTNVIATGQTIGRLNGWRDNVIAKIGLSRIGKISLRDCNESSVVLNQLKIARDRFVEACDDALYCSFCSDEVATDYLVKAGIDISRPFLVVNVFFADDFPARETVRYAHCKAIVGGCAALIDYVAQHYGYQVLFVPTVAKEMDAIRTCQEMLKERSCLLNQNYDYKIIRGVISKSQLCVSMKHHPVVYAFGSSVPAVTIGGNDYFRHKNLGLMRLYEMEQYYLDADVLLNSGACSIVDRAIRESLLIREKLNAKVSELATVSRSIITETANMISSQCGL